MHRFAAPAAVAALAVLAALTAPASAVPVPALWGRSGPPEGAEACTIFPPDNYWHADVSSLPVHGRSDAWITSMGGAGQRLHPDFGPSGGEIPYGIPYAIVDGSHATHDIAFEYDDQSDPGPYPFGPDIPIEGGQAAEGDRHALMLDKDTCRLYELFYANWNGGSPTAGSGAVFELGSNALRPAGWTSADAAGLPIFPGLLRRDEVLAGNVDHAIRITASSTSRAYLWPARHFASNATNPNLPPMGAWFRMKSSFDISSFSPHTQTILRAFKKYGAIVADNGSNWYFTGAADEGWETSVLDELKSIPAGAFEAVDASVLMVSQDSGQVRAATTTPVIPTTVATTTTAVATTAAPATTYPRVPREPSQPVGDTTSTTAGAVDRAAVARITTTTALPSLGSAPERDDVGVLPADDDEQAQVGLTATSGRGGVAWWMWVSIALTVAAIAATVTSIRGRLQRRRR